MCGLTGYFHLSGHGRIDVHVLQRMTQALFHRGPDSEGSFSDERVGLGFRRLKIIDLETGDQPLYNEDQSLVLICNGEIYNYRELRESLRQKGHRFCSNSDVEVILHLYEEYATDFLHLLNGQFAFALYDRKTGSLFLARDQLGINPLFYMVVNGLLIFSSEIKGILAHPDAYREVDLIGLDQIMSFPGLVSPRTMFKDIKSLPNGHFLLLKEGNLKLVEYWDLDYPRIGDISYDQPEQSYVERLLHLLTRSVQYRLQADVPTGFYLSGGLDSSLIAALIKRASPDTLRHSFSIAFSQQDINEAKYQQEMAEHVGSQHHEILFTDEHIPAQLARVIYHSEMPLKETYNTASILLSQCVKNTGVTVILTGEGSDELFAGYVGYRLDHYRAQAEKRYDLEAILEEDMREKLWKNRDLFYEKDYYAFGETKAALYSDAVNDYLRSQPDLHSDLVNKERLQDRHILHQRAYLDYKLRLSDHLLSDHGDRMAMAHSVEARYPFLDINVVDFARYVPPDLKLHHQTEKYLVKKVAQELVPSSIVQREKFAFVAPGSPKLLAQHIDWVQHILSTERIKHEGYFNPAAVEHLKKQYVQKNFRLNVPFDSDLLISVITFGLFLELFNLPTLG